MQALLIGGTGFIGRHAVPEFLDHGYDVTVFSRGRQDDPFGDHGALSYYEGDRDDRTALEAARDAVDPDVVVDICAYYPRQVEATMEVFADADAYVFVSSASAYDMDPVRLPTREGDPLLDCTPEQAEDDTIENYGARKAECDRICFAAAERGVPAVVVRPVVVYGPYDHSGRHDYWFHRVASYDRILVPGDGDGTYHRVYVEDLARALRLVAERGEPGEAYNAAERRTAWLDRTVDLAADALDTTVETVHASARELGSGGVSPGDFPLYAPFPLVAASGRLAALGWESTPLPETYARTVAEYLDSGRAGEAPEGVGVDRATEERLIEALTG